MPLAACAAALVASFVAALAPSAAHAETRYSLVGGCFALRSEAANRLVARDGDGYRASAAGVAGAELFRMQATDLGEYLLYGEQRDFLARGDGPLTAGTVESAEKPSFLADWRVEPAAGSAFRLELRGRSSGSRRHGRGVLAVDLTDNRLVAEGPRFDGERARFEFERARGCQRYPEIGTQATGRPFTGPTPYAGVRGLLDSHLHLGAFEFLGGAHCGRPWHRFGAPFALRDCPDHKLGGTGAGLESLLSGEPTHDTRGWPTFRDWPDHDSLTHEQTYYKWLERAWRGGLRLIVNDLVENRTLCEIYPPLNETKRGKRETCDEMASARLQLRRLHQLEDYIDAQEGGPGRGWFRIVGNPFEARRVINQGKVAVVMGMETSEPFGCGLGPGPHCNRADIRRELDRFHELGVRSVFPVHKFDNALGGTRMDAGETGAAVNAGNFYATGRFWDVEGADEVPGCRGGQHDNPQLSVGVDPFPGEPDLIAGGFQALEGQLPPGAEPPVYEDPPPHCNTRGLTEKGEYLIRLMVRRGMIVEPDHLSVRSQRRVMNMLEARNYSGVIASHTWSDPAAWPRIYDLGGIVTPITEEANDFVGEWRHLRRVRSDRFYFGMGFGADSNGLHVQPPPSETAGEEPVSYPVRSFDGGVTLARQRSGQRVWDINKDGVDHYGLHPDWVESLRLAGGDQLVRDLGRGAEAYLQMWERAVGVPAEGCKPARDSFDATSVNGLRLGQSATSALRSAGQPSGRRGRAYHYCVRGGGRLGAAFSDGGSLGLIATNAPGYSARGVSPGDPAGRLDGTTSLGNGLRVDRTAGGTAFVYRVRGGEVRAVGVAVGSVAGSSERLDRDLRLAI